MNVDSRVEYLAPEDDAKAKRRCKCEFSGGGFPSKVCAYHSRLAAPPAGGEAVAWMISDPAGDLATVVTLRPQDPVSKAGLVITPLYTRPAESEALLKAKEALLDANRNGYTRGNEALIAINAALDDLKGRT